MPYYLVTGDNGVYISHNYAQAFRCREYFRRNRIKRYEWFEEAEDDGKEHLGRILPRNVPVPVLLEADEMYTITKLLKKQKEAAAKATAATTVGKGERV